jgi:hypothetical protein
MIKLVNFIPLREDKNMETAVEKTLKGIGVRVSKTDAYRDTLGWTVDLVINNMGKYHNITDILNDYNDEKENGAPELSDVDKIGSNKYRFYIKNYSKR